MPGISALGMRQATNVTWVRSVARWPTILTSTGWVRVVRHVQPILMTLCSQSAATPISTAHHKGKRLVKKFAVAGGLAPGTIAPGTQRRTSVSMAANANCLARNFKAILTSVPLPNTLQLRWLMSSRPGVHVTRTSTLTLTLIISGPLVRVLADFHRMSAVTLPTALSAAVLVATPVATQCSAVRASRLARPVLELTSSSVLAYDHSSSSGRDEHTIADFHV